MYAFRNGISDYLTTLSIEGLLYLVSGYLGQIPKFYGLIVGFYALNSKYPELFANKKHCPLPIRGLLLWAAIVIGFLHTVYVIYHYGQSEGSAVQALNVGITLSLTNGLDMIALFIIGVTVANFGQNCRQGGNVHSTSCKTWVIAVENTLDEYGRLKEFLSPILFTTIMTCSLGKHVLGKQLYELVFNDTFF